MPPPASNPAPSSESRNTGGLAGVLRSLTSGKGSKATASTPIPASATSNLQLAQQLNGQEARRGAKHGGPAEFEALYEKLKPGHTYTERIAAAESLKLAVSQYPLSSVTSIWFAGKDLINAENPIEARRAGFSLLTACVRHVASTDLERREYFVTLTAPLALEDFNLQLAAVVELAKNGKDLSGFHYDMIPLLSRWLRMVWDAYAIARKQPQSASKLRGPMREETNVHQLFDFIFNVIKFSFNVSDDVELGKLIDNIIFVASNATLHTEIKSCIRVLDAIVTYGAIPTDKLRDFVVVLCSIYFLVKENREQAWHTLSNLCRSHNGHTAIRILLDVIRCPIDKTPIGKEVTKQVRGSLSVLQSIVLENGKDGYPMIPLSLLVEGLESSVQIGEPKIDQDVIRLIAAIFGNDNEPIRPMIVDEDWASILEVAAKAVQVLDGSDIESQPSTKSSQSLRSRDSTVDLRTTVEDTFQKLVERIEYILNSSQEELLQRESCMMFFSKVPGHLHDSGAQLVIRYYSELRLCYPSDAMWEANNKLILESFFADTYRPAEIRLEALKVVTEVYDVVEAMDEFKESGVRQGLIVAILTGLTEESDVAIVQGIANFAVNVCDTAELELFDTVVGRLHQCVLQGRHKAAPAPSGARPGASTLQTTSPKFKGNEAGTTPSSVITRALVQIFMRSMDNSTEKALRSFDRILEIARSSKCDNESRLSAMKMFFRLRADWANRIFLTPFTEADALAASLYRTADSLAKKQAIDDAMPTRNTRIEDLRNMRNAAGQAGGPAARAVSGVTRALQVDHQLWMTPDPGALPEQLSNKASTLLVSALTDSVVKETTAEGIVAKDDVHQRPIQINVWLETVIDLLQQGCDWEVYSYIIVHLPSQLSNHTLFKAAVPQVKMLRSVICEQIKNGSFHEPPISSGLRKADVAMCLFQVLTMIMSYHRHFSRGEEDEIVKCFIHGIATWERSAKCCIHALSICCHEFPASMKLVLGSLLLKLSQIITQPQVAIHILEFLSRLARLPDLYSNFREDEFRTVFGICFRYLQYVRDQRSKPVSNRNSTISPRPGTSSDSPTLESQTAKTSTASDDVPQYVFSLAYHVITYWFLSLKLSDRATHVSWITKNLVWVDDLGKQRLDEQGEVTLDFMRRTAYADVDESRADEDFTPENHGDILKERWIVGQCIVTVEQATRTGWAQITKRQPSATSHYMVRQKFDPPQAHQVVSPADGVRDPTRFNTNFFLPANIPVQLVAPVPEWAKPIHLPDDDMINRAIKNMDRISTVDGHKVGVAYIGAGQVHEKEILPNVSGSTDYMVFLAGLGTLTKLKGATFNTQGLDRQFDSDGEFTICWRDRVTELVFHVTTMMPTNLEQDPLCTAKKRHIGNDFVNIIFNNSGNPFDFNTFPSEFNYVNIVITPESRASFIASRDRANVDPDSSYYKVQVMGKDGFPEISPASETKILSLRALPGFIRLVALNASVFCHVWANRGGEHVSSWRSRLREIQRLRDKYKNAPLSTASPPATSQGQGISQQDARNVRDSFNNLRRASVANFLTNVNEHDTRSSTRSPSNDKGEGGEGGADRERDDDLVATLDFSRWAHTYGDKMN